MQSQPLGAKLGEIRYRKEIVKQQLGKSKSFENEFTQTEFKKLLKPKLKETEILFKKLQKQGVALTPFLEIGSEHALRPSMLESKFKARGYATDISLYSLKKAREFAKKFGYKKTAKAVCADAENLPFKSNCFPFVFVYESLHHFKDPKIPLRELVRVLKPGGYCLVGLDPIKQLFQLSLWNRPNKLRLWEKILKVFLILPFISHIGKSEIEHGIIETAFDLKTWQDALSIFDEVEVTMWAYPFGPTETVKKTNRKDWINPSLPTKIALFLFGGGLQAICKKKSAKKLLVPQDLETLLICPNCLKNKKGEQDLAKTKNIFTCHKCHTIFNKKNGVLVLLEDSLAKKIF